MSDKVYTSSFSGAQIDEAVDKVINNKIGGADWEAKEGEAGYIENRTHYIEKTLLAEQCSVGSVYEEDLENLPIAFRFIDDYELESYPFVNLRIVDDTNNEEFDFKINLENKEQQNFDFGFIYVHKYDGGGIPISIASLMGNPVDLYEMKYNTINENYLPKTVLKTTPQTLSNNDKNQVKENLGLHDAMLNVTYSDLKSLRDNSKLIPGQQYRITDYLTTTTQANTQSAGHQFDIIVVADDVNVLNENARAIQHEGDTYFADSDLNAWELKYCLDNDTDRFAWADATNGKGVIYYMKDEFNNECPYDFKNIQFARWELSNPVGYRNDYDFENYEDNWIQEETQFDSLKTGFYGLDGSGNVFTYVYNEDEEYYKYKVEYTISESPTYCYTFGKDTDYSMNGSNYSNVIKKYKSSNKIQLNNIVFLGTGCHDNSFGNSCYNNSFGDGCYYNSFGNYCRDNSFGTGCYNNSFGNYCYGNSFGEDCSYNSFRTSCYSNSFGYDCYYNSFGTRCNINSFGNDCYYNSFGIICYNNSFGNYCSNNSFGTKCSFNSFGESSFNIKSYYRYIIFDNGNSYIYLNCTSTTSSSKYFQNVRIGLGVNNTTTYKTISDSNVGQTYQTLYKPTDSKELTA